MSRIGKLPIVLPQQVKVTVSDENLVTIKGPKGELKQMVDPSKYINDLMAAQNNIASIPWIKGGGAGVGVIDGVVMIRFLSERGYWRCKNLITESLGHESPMRKSE